MIIVEGVEDHAAGAARPDESQRPEQSQLMGDGGLGDADELRQIADAQLALGERVEQPDPGRVAEHRESGRKRPAARSPTRRGLSTSRSPLRWVVSQTSVIV